MIGKAMYILMAIHSRVIILINNEQNTKAIQLYLWHFVIFHKINSNYFTPMKPKDKAKTNAKAKSKAKSKAKAKTNANANGSEYKTKEERQEQVRNIISEITKLGLSIQYQPVKELYECLRRYIEQGVAVKINIPFDEINRTIVGQLKIGKREECVVCLQNHYKQ